MKKWILLAAALVLLAGAAAAYIKYAKPPFRVVLYNAGGGEVDIEVKSIGDVVIELGLQGAQIAPLWKQPAIDIIVAEDLVFRGEQYRAGDRLTSTREGELVKQPWYRAFYNDIRYYAWKVKQPAEPEPRTAYVRAEEVDLRPGPDAGSEKRATLRFGTEVQVLEERGEWFRVTVIDPRARGWLHRAVTSSSRQQLDALRQQNRVPRLILHVRVQTATELQTQTLAGGLLIPKERFERGDYTPEFQPRDCLLFASENLEQAPRPFKIGGQTIADPSAGKFYCLSEPGNFEEAQVLAQK